MYEIVVPDDLSSYEFYRNVLQKVNSVYLESDTQFLFDFTRTKKIEPLVIPNLLCLAYQIQKEKCPAPIIRIPDTYSTAPLKNYFNNIKFFYYAIKYKLFCFEQSPYDGMTGKKIDPLCETLLFDVSNSRDEILRGASLYISPFAEQYLPKFDVSIYGEKKDNLTNEITQFLFEMILNSKEHGQSFSFTTLHAKYSFKVIYIAVSDCGSGFLETMHSEPKAEDESEEWYRKRIHVQDEIHAIILGIYKRQSSRVYGLYNIIRKTLELQGRVRVHSNNTQIIFTPHIYYAFCNNELLQNEDFYKYNVKHTSYFRGVHIEIELPFM